MTPNDWHALELFRLGGQTALVTGGAGFYGRPIARALAQAGAKVIVASRSIERCTAYAAELSAEGLECAAESFDMGDAGSISDLVARLTEAHGGVDILINNALHRMPTHYDEATPDQWAEGLRANITGIHLCTQQFSVGMRARKRGAIVNVASIYGVVAPHFGVYDGMAFSSPPDYAFTKGGLIAYTRYCASLFAPDGVRVNCVSPGGYYSGQDPTFVARYNARVPLGRMAEDADIAGPVVFLASDAARYVTGTNLLVDGGLTIR